VALACIAANPSSRLQMAAGAAKYIAVHNAVQSFIGLSAAMKKGNQN